MEISTGIVQMQGIMPRLILTLIIGIFGRCATRSFFYSGLIDP